MYWTRAVTTNNSVNGDYKVVLTIQEDKNEQYTMSGTINSNPFKTMVDSGSPVTFFRIDEKNNETEDVIHS